jgi:hypothetical protein
MQYIRKRSATDPNQDPSRFEELEQLKTKAQNTLNDLGCTLVAQNLLSSPRRKIFDAALQLLISLLEGGNKNVQVSHNIIHQSQYSCCMRSRINWKSTFIVFVKSDSFIHFINDCKAASIVQRKARLP